MLVVPEVGDVSRCAGARASRGEIRTELLAFVGLCIALCLVGLAYYASQYRQGASAAASSAASHDTTALALSSTEVSTSSLPATFAPASDTVTLYEFDSFDPSCTSCAGVHAAVMAAVASLPSSAVYHFRAYPIARPLSDDASSTPVFDPRDILGLCIASATQAQGDGAILAYAAAAYASASATPDALLSAIPAADRDAAENCVAAMPENDMPITDVLSRYQYDQVPSAPAVFIQIPGVPDPISIGADPKNIAAVLQSLVADPAGFAASLREQYEKRAQ